MGLQEFPINLNIIPCEINKKNEFFSSIGNIEYSWTGREDAGIVNIFIEESVQMIINAISMFEKGYFDCSYYSLRQALEIATTMVYLVDIDDKKRKSTLSDWKNKRWFPMDKKMKEYLSDNGCLFADMMENMGDYFEEVEKRRKLYGKCVHKQGFNYFYVLRNNYLRDLNMEIKMFEEDVAFCIGTVAVMRLAVDPFPILLMDDEIFNRTGYLKTKPYSDEFVEKYIGINVINQYKKTQVYQDKYNDIIKKERQPDSVTQVLKNQYINISKLDEIFEHINLLSYLDTRAVRIVSRFPHISAVYFYYSLIFYCTNNQSKRKKQSWSSKDFREFDKNLNKYNIVYDEVYISCLKINGETIFIEHNSKMNENDIDLIKKLEQWLSRVEKE